MSIQNVNDSWDVLLDHSEFPQQEPAAEDGAGGDDMDLYQEDTVTQYDYLSQNIGINWWSNASIHPVMDESGLILTASYGPFDQRIVHPDFQVQEVEAEAGVGGEDMEFWDEPTVDKYAFVSQDSPFHLVENESSHDILDEPGLVLTPGYQEFDQRIVRSDEYAWPSDNHETGLNRDTETEAGQGGQDMEFWMEDGSVRWETISTVPFMFVQNFSSWPLLPDYPAILTPEYQQFDRKREVDLGVGTSGSVRDHRNRPLTATIALLDSEGSVVISDAIEGNFTIVAPPPEGVAEGDDRPGTTEDYDLWVSPTEGIEHFEDDATASLADIDLTYHAAQGTVTDVHGDPVAGDTVFALGESYITDEDGEFEILAPVGVPFPVIGLTASREKTAEIGDTDTVNFQYGGIVVRVMDPTDSSPMGGVPTDISGEMHYTDAQGEVELTQVPLGVHNILVMDHFTEQVTVDFEGHRVEEHFGADPFASEDEASVRGLTFRLRDRQTRREVLETTVRVPGVGIRTETDRAGRASVLYDEDEIHHVEEVQERDELQIAVALEDPRYKAQTFWIDPHDPLTFYEIELQPSTQTVNH